jgi:hypothetical protein
MNIMYQKSGLKGRLQLPLNPNSQHERLRNMSKADSSTTPIRSRRAVLAGLASAGAIAAIPTTAAAMPSPADPVIALAARVVDAWDDFEAKVSAQNDCEEAVFEWRKLNPGPTVRSVFTGSDAEYLAWIISHDPSTDVTAKKYETDHADWKARERLVEREAGYTRADQARDRASDRFGDLRDDLVAVRPTTIAGLRAKAHAARVSSDEDLQQQIVFDIGVLFGDLDHDEQPVLSSS